MLGLRIFGDISFGEDSVQMDIEFGETYDYRKEIKRLRARAAKECG